MRSLQAAGAALRPLARRSLLRAPISVRPPTTPHLSRRYHNPDPRSLVNKPPARPPAPTTPRPPPRRRTILSPRYLPILLALAAGGVAWDSQWLFPDSSSSVSDDPSSATILGDARRFIRFNVVARDQVSPTSFILTLKPPHASSSQLSSLWDVFDLWCVEVKQPQIQVAREYTPLPPGADPDALRLYVRAVRGGEVSTYLSRLSPAAGDAVELRGPHGEFDLRSRLGRAGERVVFLAGGTGIASALQAAHAVLPLEGGPSMTIFWAVRSRDEIQTPSGRPAPVPGKSRNCWNPFSARRSAEPGIRAEALSADAGSPSPIGRELLALKEKYPDRLDVRVVVDQENTAIQESDLASALTSPTSSTTTSSDDCRFHSQTAHLGMVDGAPNAGKKLSFKEDDCACPKHDGSVPGKNLFVVSGPEGFVQAYAGAKIWRDGGQLQGPVGGMLGRMQRQNPGLLRDWVVLKL
ncbi:oxidoreductase FAD-binding domain-containing protein [Colletotrichum plurivorum]|uniref:Oxidoreductase FAD-binding domain-containing protein n=1 Tax=Colletotrichum plurivorum TaxID=2175906 RepID=A0A8H6NS86_9PEZI|nr:oxidoreductase FAD-binding domain-containing protein [Colletotrichum plurivorum]